MSERRLRSASPREAALIMLDARFGVPQAPPRSAKLAAFQQDAVDRLRGILSRWRGAVLADSVGLGKTHIAAALLRTLPGRAGEALVVGPSVLRAHWQRHLHGVRSWRWCSHTALSRGSAPQGEWTLVVVDEAHAFRNPAARRYRHLGLACAGSPILLLSATPVNNSLFDLYWMIRLFAHDGAFHELGVPDMRAAFEAAARSNDVTDVRRIAEAIMVRRTREIVREHCSADRRPGLVFPRTQPIRTLPYQLSLAAGELDSVLHVIEQLRFPAHTVLEKAAPRALLRIGLLKRLESSRAAFESSLTRQLRLLIAFQTAWRNGLLLLAKDYGRLVRNGGDTQLLLDAAVLAPLPATVDRARVLADANHDTASLRALLGIRWNEESDGKMARLQELLRGELKGRRVLVFSEYAETAVALWKELRDEFRTALVHGAAAHLGRSSASRRAIIERFAPYANRVRQPHARERVDILIATDVLAEGLNLQDASALVSFDTPWNPVRLAQRIGRIDRLGSPHEHVDIYTFAPDSALDSMLGLMRRLRRKLRAIRIAGGDAPRLAPATRGRTRQRAAASLGGDSTERLRCEHRRVRAQTAPLSSIHAIPVARMPWDERGAFLCCVQRGNDTRFLIIDANRRMAEYERWEALLESALRLESLTMPDHQQISRVIRSVLRANAEAAAIRQAPIRADQRRRMRCARAIRNWLRGRSPWPGPADHTLADTLLKRVADMSVPLEVDAILDSLSASNLSPDSPQEPRGRQAVNPARTRAGTATARVIAVLELRPSE